MSDDEDWGWLKWRALIAFGVLFAMLLVFSIFDLVFLTLSRGGMATVSESRVSTSRRGVRSVTMYFKYKDSAGNERGGSINLGDVPEPEPGEQFEIQYLPMWLLDSVDAARPARGPNWFVLGGFFFVTLGFAFFAYRAIYPPGETPRRGPARRR